jgi:hypothetical protein
MGTNNYAGKWIQMDSFTSQTTDGSGQITVTLNKTPTADDSIILQCSGVAGAFAEFTSRSGTSLVVTIRSKYDKATDTNATLGTLPASVTADSTVGGPTFTSSTFNTATRAQDTGATLAVEGHSHTIQVDKISTHSHGIDTFTGTLLSTLNSTGGLTLTVLYAYTP